ncbi:MAG: HWE histidine kinase domain-containing protein [Pseudomonadota bacterium]
MKTEQFGGDFNWRSLAVRAGEVGRWIWYIDSGDCEIDETLRSMTGLTDAPARLPVDDFTAHVHGDDRPYISLALEEALAADGTFSVEFRFNRPDGQTIWLAGQGQLTKAPDGARVLVGVNYDVTDTRVSQERSDLVAGEMAHRVKNILTIVLSIFRSTARSASDVNALSSAFTERINALAALNDLILSARGKGTSTEALVDAVLRPVDGRAVHRDVDSFALNDTAAQTLTLVLNELMTNALKHGALASEAGKVRLRLEIEGNVLRLQWHEDAAYEVKAPTKTGGFGMQVLNSMTAATFSGRPTFDWRPEGLRFQCEWPADEMAAVTVGRQPGG